MQQVHATPCHPHLRVERRARLVSSACNHADDALTDVRDVFAQTQRSFASAAQYQTRAPPHIRRNSARPCRLRPRVAASGSGRARAKQPRVKLVLQEQRSPQLRDVRALALLFSFGVGKDQCVAGSAAEYPSLTRPERDHYGVAKISPRADGEAGERWRRSARDVGDGTGQSRAGGQGPVQRRSRRVARSETRRGRGLLPFLVRGPRAPAARPNSAPSILGVSLSLL